MKIDITTPSSLWLLASIHLWHLWISSMT